MRTSLWKALLVLGWLCLGRDPAWAQQPLQFQWARATSFKETGGFTFSGFRPSSTHLSNKGEVFTKGLYSKSLIFGNDTLWANDTSYHTALVKYDAFGRRKWIVNYGLTRGFYVPNGDLFAADNNICTVPEGDTVVLVDYIRGRVRLGNTTFVDPDSITHSSDPDYFVAWLDSAGGVARALQLQGITVRWVKTDAQHNLYLAGNCQQQQVIIGADTVQVSTTTPRATCWFKLRPNGRLVWFRNLASEQWVFDFKVSPAGLVKMTYMPPLALTTTIFTSLTCDFLGNPTPSPIARSGYEETDSAANRYLGIWYDTLRLPGRTLISRAADIQDIVIAKVDAGGQYTWFQPMRYHPSAPPVMNGDVPPIVEISGMKLIGDELVVVVMLYDWSQGGYYFDIAGQTVHLNQITLPIVVRLDATTGQVKALYRADMEQEHTILPIWRFTSNQRGEFLTTLTWVPPTPALDTLRFAQFEVPVGDGVHPGVINTAVFKAGNAYNIISGTVFIDANADGVRQANELPYPGAMVSVQRGPVYAHRYVNSASNGAYAAYVPPGDYLVNPTPPPYYQLWTPGNPTPITFPGYGNSVTRDLALVPIPSQPDVQVSITPIGRARPGFALGYYVTYRNAGTVPLQNLTLSLTPDARLVFGSATVALTPGGGGFTFSVPSLLPTRSGAFTVWFTVPAPTPLGVRLLTRASIPYAADMAPSDNEETAAITVTGSYDPNDLSVSHTTITSSQAVNGQWLDYTVRFQNLGTDTAFSVIVTDSLSITQLNIGSLTVTAASHNCLWRYDFAGHLTVTFPQILLPPRQTNVAASDGFVRFSVRTQPTLIPGDSIHNKVPIYFDYNAPIWTNEVVTIVDRPLGLPSVGDTGAAQVWPNPAHERLQVQVPESGPLSLSLMDAVGRTVRTLTADAVSGRAMMLDVRGLPPGLYVLRGQGLTNCFSRSLLIR